MSILDNAMQKLDKALQFGSSVFENIGDAWDEKLEELKQKATEFNRLYTELESKRPIAMQDPETYERYNELMNKGEWIKNTISGITTGIDWGSNFLFGPKPPPVSDMGAIQLIPVATMVTAISVLGIWITNAYVELETLNTAERLASQGIDIAEFFKQKNKNIFSSAEGAFKALTPLLILGGVIWFFRDDIQKTLRKRYGR